MANRYGVAIAVFGCVAIVLGATIGLILHFTLEPREGNERRDVLVDCLPEVANQEEHKGRCEERRYVKGGVIKGSHAKQVKYTRFTRKAQFSTVLCSAGVVGRSLVMPAPPGVHFPCRRATATPARRIRRSVNAMSSVALRRRHFSAKTSRRWWWRSRSRAASESGSR